MNARPLRRTKGRFPRRAAIGSIQRMYQGWKVGVRTMPAPSTHSSVRSRSKRLHADQQMTPIMIAAAARRASSGSPVSTSSAVNGPFMNHQFSLYVRRPAKRAEPADRYGEYRATITSANPMKARHPSRRTSPGRAAAGANLVSAESASAAPAATATTCCPCAGAPPAEHTGSAVSGAGWEVVRLASREAGTRSLAHIAIASMSSPRGSR